MKKKSPENLKKHIKKPKKKKNQRLQLQNFHQHLQALFLAYLFIFGIKCGFKKKDFSFTGHFQA